MKKYFGTGDDPFSFYLRQKEAESPAPETSTVDESAEVVTAADIVAEDGGAVGVEVDEDLFNVAIMIPADFDVALSLYPICIHLSKSGQSTACSSLTFYFSGLFPYHI